MRSPAQRIRRWSLVLIILAALGTSGVFFARVYSQAADKPLRSRFTPGVYQDAQGFKLPYRLLAPQGYDARQRYPLIIFLHGSGERGTDNQLQLTKGLPILAEQLEKGKYHCFVLAPQCPPKHAWVNAEYDDNRFIPLKKTSKAMRLTLELLDKLQRDYRIDPDRIYLVGISMGGSGVWDLLTRKPGRWAAAVPMCGRADTQTAPQLTRVPLWVFHGGRDKTVGVEWSRRMVAAIRKAGGHPQYTEYPRAGHKCWQNACAEPGLLLWLLAQKRAGD